MEYSICKEAYIAGATWQREQLIKELRKFVNANTKANFVMRTNELCETEYYVNKETLLAKLDLLEKGGE